MRMLTLRLKELMGQARGGLKRLMVIYMYSIDGKQYLDYYGCIKIIFTSFCFICCIHFMQILRNYDTAIYAKYMNMII